MQLRGCAHLRSPAWRRLGFLISFLIAEAFTYGQTKALRVFLAPEKPQPEYSLKNNAHYEEDYGSRCTASEICSYSRNQTRKCNDMVHFKTPSFLEKPTVRVQPPPKAVGCSEGLGVALLGTMDLKRLPQKGRQLQRSMPLPALPKK